MLPRIFLAVIHGKTCKLACSSISMWGTPGLSFPCLALLLISGEWEKSRVLLRHEAARTSSTSQRQHSLISGHAQPNSEAIS